MGTTKKCLGSLRRGEKPIGEGLRKKIDQANEEIAKM